MASRTVDPYRDLDVIDARAPRANQAVIALGCIAALVTGWWGLVALLAAQLLIGLRFGRRFCLPCVLYFEVLQRILGEGEIEDSRPPRFANILGALVLSGATVAYSIGFGTAGDVLTATVAFLAGVAAVTGFCTGCELYRVGARLKGIRPGDARVLDLTDLGATPSETTVVQFTHPLCSGCRSLTRRLEAEGRPVVLIDVSTRADLARKYGITVVPTAVAVASDGKVVARLA